MKIWLSHHWPGQEDRCVHIGRQWVCRRCLVLYPTAFAVMGLALAGVRWPAIDDAWFAWVLPIPMMVDFAAEHLGLARHSPRRLVVCTALAAPAVGRGLARYLRHPGDRLFWAAVVVWSIVALVAVSVGVRRRRRSVGPGHAAELEGIVEEVVVGDDPHRHAGAAGGPQR